MSDKYDQKYYSKKLLSKECNNGHVYAQETVKTLPDGDILGDTYIKAASGYRDDSIRIYRNFIKQYEDKGSVAGCTLDWVYSVIKIIVDIEDGTVTNSHGKGIAIESQDRAQAITNALGLSGKKVESKDKLNSMIDILLSRFPLQVGATKADTTKQTNDIIDQLKRSNLYKISHLQVWINDHEGMIKKISKRRNK